MRKKILIGILCLIGACGVLGGVYAYLTDADVAVNSVTIGTTDTPIVEDFDPPDELHPGTIIHKDVKMKNSGTTPVYIRIRAAFTDGDIEEHCTVDWNKTDYDYNEADNFYYYKKVLKPGETAPSLFTNIKLDKDIPEGEIKDFDVIVYGESMVSKGYDTYQKAWADFDKKS